MHQDCLDAYLEYQKRNSIVRDKKETEGLEEEKIESQFPNEENNIQKENNQSIPIKVDEDYTIGIILV